MFYAEDHCSLRWPVLFNGIVWPVLFVACVIVPAVTGNVLITYLAAIAFILCLVPGGSIIGLVTAWPTGIRIDADGIRIGGVHRAEQHPGQGPEKKLPPVSAQRRQVFSCPWNGVQRVAVVTDRAELKKLVRSSRGHNTPVGILWAYWMRAALVVNVDLAAAHVPQFRPPDTQSHWFRMSRYNRAVPSPVWLAPTRHPDRLREALAQVSAPGSIPSGQETRGS